MSGGDLLDPLFTTAAMAAVFSDRGRLQGMLDFEAALARAEAACGVIPAAAAEPIAAQCRAERFDLAALGQAAALAGNLAIPLVKALTERVGRADAAAARYVHWGATSQDAIDTGLVLQSRAALDLIEVDLDRLGTACAGLAATHAATLLAGRTWLQQALPVTFGLKAAGWLDALGRHRTRLAGLRPRLLAVQFGGPAGTLAPLGTDGLAVGAAVATELGLAWPDLPWHAQRDRLAEAATSLGLLVGSLGKIGRDIALMTQTEVAEAFEPDAPGRGGSSAMPHKRNPVGCAVALAAAARVPALVATMLGAMPQEHERGLGDWQAEWETLPEIFRLAAGALARLVEVIEGLELDPARMLANLELSRGQIFAAGVAMALAPALGAGPAHALVEAAAHRAAAQGRHLHAVLAEDAAVQRHLAPAALAALFDPAAATGAAAALIERALARWRGDPRVP